MGEFIISGMSDVNCPMAVYPEWAFRNLEQLNFSHHRTQTGKLYSYRWGGFSKFRVPLRFVSSTDQSRINSWWASHQDIAFTLDSSETETTYLCRIMNGSKPMHRFEEPYQHLFAGEMQLESLEEGPPRGRPFTVDDQIFGLLDQIYNPIY